jgi:histidyl-tRNA synthetase
VWNRVEAVAREVFRAYNYHEIRTPILEETQLFARGVGEDTDIVTKEMYTFTDRDETSLTLRPENTASVIRAYIEHRLDQRPGVQKLYYIGPMFRRERPQKGRYRQFFQIGAEAIGSESPVVDAEVIEMVMEVLQRAGLRDARLLLNSVGDHNCRPQYVEHLRQQLQGVASQMCGDCQRRAATNPLRVLDCKVEADQPIIDQLPSILDYLCDPCRAHFEAVKQYLLDRGIAYDVRPRMVRGLDYYMRTTFEVVHGALGAQNSVLGGGRYDGLAESLGSKVHSPGIGFSIGEDRLVMSVETGQKPAPLDLFIAALGEPAVRHAALLARDLRRAGFSVELVEGKLKRSLELANKFGARFTLILGENEMTAGRYAVKNMTTGEQRDVARGEIAAVLGPGFAAAAAAVLAGATSEPTAITVPAATIAPAAPTAPTAPTAPAAVPTTAPPAEPTPKE